MENILSPIEIRIIGSLIEKEITTPDYYPLTLNALTASCNQKSNRDPVMNLDEKTIVRALEELRFKQLIWQTSSMESRVPKYKHNIGIFNFTLAEIAVLCELFLRGPQTLGELRVHTERLNKFNDLTEIEEVLDKLMKSEAGPYVVHLPRESGRRERRYAHLFCGEVKVNLNPPMEQAALEVRSENERIELLENEVTSLRKEINELKEQFNLFKKQFE